MVDELEALVNTLNLLAALQRRGVLNLLTALVENVGEVTDELVSWLSKPENTRAIKNVAIMYAAAREIDPEVLRRLMLAISRGMDRGLMEAERDGMSLVGILRYLNDPDVNRAIRFILGFLKGMGESLAHGTH